MSQQEKIDTINSVNRGFRKYAVKSIVTYRNHWLKVELGCHHEDLGVYLALLSLPKY